MGGKNGSYINYTDAVNGEKRKTIQNLLLHSFCILLTVGMTDIAFCAVFRGVAAVLLHGVHYAPDRMAFAAHLFIGDYLSVMDNLHDGAYSKHGRDHCDCPGNPAASAEVL